MQLIHTLYEPEGAGPHPALLTLHGRGANAFDLLGLAPYLCGGKFLMICPQGPLETPIGPDAVGYAWYPMSMGGPLDVAAILSSQKLLLAFLDECVKRYPIDAKKLAVLGFSQGGLLAYSLALVYPERFAALAALSSWLPKELVQELSVGEGVRTLPTLVQHGTQDPMIEVDRARDSVERLRDLKVPLTYREYDMGHEIRPRSLTDLSAWLEKNVGATGRSPLQE
ncbi:MAG: dienelactone hydrolase family protein [Deltaproteobacteria bacterium]|nr:dienelactone hydrolase family protein [Deltaproteobacteria bacterium]